MSAAPAWLVVALHLLFALAETVGWGQMARRFGYSAAATEHTRALALNQGAYNAGIACVLGWTLLTGRTEAALALLAFITAMGVVGGASVRWTIAVIQSVPALLAIAALLWVTL